MLVLKILGFIFLIPGVFLVFMARRIVEKYKLDEKVDIDFESELDTEELSRFRINKAVVNTKMLGMLVALPGLILILIAFR